MAALKGATAFPIPYSILPQSRDSCLIDQFSFECYVPEEASAKLVFKGWKSVCGREGSARTHAVCFAELLVPAVCLLTAY